MPAQGWCLGRPARAAPPGRAGRLPAADVGLHCGLAEEMLDEEMQTMTEPETPAHRRRNRRVIPVHCTQHGGVPGFTNLVVRRVGGDAELHPAGECVIELDPHAAGGCVIVLNEAAALELFDVLGEWLG